MHRSLAIFALMMGLAVLMVAATCSAELTRHDLGRTVKFKVLVDKTMQPEAGWHTEQWMVRETAEAGFNVWSPRRANDLAEVRQVTEWCAEEGILHIPWMRGTLTAGLEDETADGKRMVWASGLEDELWSPNSDELWDWMTRKIISYAKISAEIPTLFGVFLDYENYRLGPNCYGLSYDDIIMARFAHEKGIKLPELAFNERAAWLRDQGLHDEFETFQVAHWRERCRALREAVDEIDPEFMFMIYPAPGTRFMVEACYPEWASEQAPLVLADPSTYGRVELLPHEQALEANRDKMLANQQYAMSRGENLLYAGGVDPNVKGADPEFSGRNAAMLMDVTDGYWIFYAGPEYEGTHREYFKWFARAHEAADSDEWDWAWEDRETPDSYDLAELEVEHPECKQFIVYGARGNFIDTLQANDEWEVHLMTGASLDYFSSADAVILQNFNQPLNRQAPLVQMLIEYVHRGGGVLLAHDTAWFMDSPWPEIAKRGYPEHNVEAERHVVEVDLVIEDVAHPALRGLESGTSFHPEYRDHMIFRPGKVGTVLVRNEFGDPVYLAGESGMGRVIFSGSYYGYLRTLEGAERELLYAAIDWLTGEGPGFGPRTTMDRDEGPHPAVRWHGRPGFD